MFIYNLFEVLTFKGRVILIQFCDEGGTARDEGVFFCLHTSFDPNKKTYFSAEAGQKVQEGMPQNNICQGRP